MPESINVALDAHVWRGVLATLEAATPIQQAKMTSRERLEWYERSHAINQIKNALPKRRRAVIEPEVTHA